MEISAKLVFVASPDTAFLSLFKHCRALHSLAILCAFLQTSRGAYRKAFLLTKITFKPPIIDQLVKEAGIDPAILDLLRRDPAIVHIVTH